MCFFVKGDLLLTLGKHVNQNVCSFLQLDTMILEKYGGRAFLEIETSDSGLGAVVYKLSLKILFQKDYIFLF